MYLDTLYICTECSENFVFHSTNLNPVLVKKRSYVLFSISCVQVFECTVIPMKRFKKSLIFFIEI